MPIARMKSSSCEGAELNLSTLFVSAVEQYWGASCIVQPSQNLEPWHVGNTQNSESKTS